MTVTEKTYVEGADGLVDWGVHHKVHPQALDFQLVIRAETANQHEDPPVTYDQKRLMASSG